MMRPALAWLAAGAAAWLAMAACRTLQGPASASGGAALVGERGPGVVRVGILVEVPGATIASGGAGVEVRIRKAGEAGVRVVRLPRATFAPADGRLRLVELREDMDAAAVAPGGTNPLDVDGTATYRGTLEVRPAGRDAITVVNVVGLEDYLRGVVPNELSPQAFPRLEALKAQAVAARSYALAHLGESAPRGFDLCATASCQVYRGRSSEHPLADRAVAETKGIVALYRGRPIHAYYTATCGGHTEDGEAVFDDDEPYLRGVACEPETRARQAVRSAAEPPHVPADAAAIVSVRDVALLEALGVLGSDEIEPAGLARGASDVELLAWTGRLKETLRRTGCEVAPSSGIVRRAGFARHLVGALCWSERAARLVADGGAEGVLSGADRSRLADPAELQALTLLAHEGVAAPLRDGSLQPDAPVTRGDAIAMLARTALAAPAPQVGEGEFAGVGDGELRLLRGDSVDRLRLDPSVRLVRDLGRAHVAAAELALAIGERVVFVQREGRVTYLEAEQPDPDGRGTAASRGYNWEVRLTPGEVAAAVSRYGNVGSVKDLVPRRIGVSGRVVELAVVGSDGELVLKGLKVRRALGVRENLFVVGREMDRGGAVERFVVAGKGWGHGVGLCQVGASGMAEAGASYEDILRHYYTGVTLSPTAF